MEAGLCVCVCVFTFTTTVGSSIFKYLDTDFNRFFLHTQTKTVDLTKNNQDVIKVQTFSFNMGSLKKKAFPV